jgi:hypothetical protein
MQLKIPWPFTYKHFMDTTRPTCTHTHPTPISFHVHDQAHLHQHPPHTHTPTHTPTHSNAHTPMQVLAGEDPASMDLAELEDAGEGATLVVSRREAWLAQMTRRAADCGTLINYIAGKVGTMEEEALAKSGVPHFMMQFYVTAETHQVGDLTGGVVVRGCTRA